MEPGANQKTNGHRINLSGPQRRGRKWINERLLIEAILWILRAEAPWAGSAVGVRPLEKGLRLVPALDQERSAGGTVNCGERSGAR